MRSAFRTALILPLALAGWPSHAQIYLCKDAAGRTITSDRPIPECADRAMRELDRAGRTRREIRPPPTAEERRQTELHEEKRKADELAAEERRRNDRLLRSRFRNEADIATTRARSIEVIDEQLKRERTILAAAEKQQQKTQSDIDALRKRNAPIPTSMQQQLDDDVQAVSDAMHKIQESESEIVQVNAKYDAMLRRYREMSGVTASK